MQNVCLAQESPSSLWAFLEDSSCKVTHNLWPPYLCPVEAGMSPTLIQLDPIS